MKVDSCPKCHWPGILYEDRTIQATIKNQFVAHVEHVELRQELGQVRWCCQLRVSDLENLKNETEKH